MNYESRKKNQEHFRISSIPNSCFLIPNSTKKGFSLVETIVAVAILAIAVAAPLTLAQKGLNASMYSRDQVTAFFLAQEAIEYVRNVRDNNNLNPISVNWMAGLDTCLNKNCGVDSFSQTIIDCSGSNSSACKLNYNSSTGLYGRASTVGGVPSVFTRTLNISVTGNEALLTSTVSWKTGKISQSISVKERLSNWFPH